MSRPRYDHLVHVLREMVLFREEALAVADAIIEAVVERLQADHAIGFGAIRISDALFTVRTEHALLNLGLATLGDLTSKTAGDLLRAKVGRKVLAEVEFVLRGYGLSLKADS